MYQAKRASAPQVSANRSLGSRGCLKQNGPEYLANHILESSILRTSQAKRARAHQVRASRSPGFRGSEGGPWGAPSCFEGNPSPAPPRHRRWGCWGSPGAALGDPSTRAQVHCPPRQPRQALDGAQNSPKNQPKWPARTIRLRNTPPPVKQTDRSRHPHNLGANGPVTHPSSAEHRPASPGTIEPRPALATRSVPRALKTRVLV